MTGVGYSHHLPDLLRSVDGGTDVDVVVDPYGMQLICDAYNAGLVTIVEGRDGAPVTAEHALNPSGRARSHTIGLTPAGAEYLRSAS